MQLSFDKESELHSVTVTLKRDDRDLTMGIVASGFNRRGDLLSSSAIVLAGVHETELVADLMREIALGWLWRNAKGAIEGPMKQFRERRNLLRREVRRGV